MMSTVMTLNDLNPQNKRFFRVFHFLAAVHISRVNCTEMVAGDRPGNPKYTFLA